MKLIVGIVLWSASIAFGQCKDPAEKPAPSPQFGDISMCHDDTIDLENVILKIQVAKLEYEKAMGRLQSQQSVIIDKVLIMNPDKLVGPNGQFVKKPAPVAPGKPASAGSIKNAPVEPAPK